MKFAGHDANDRWASNQLYWSRCQRPACRVLIFGKVAMAGYNAASPRIFSATLCDPEKFIILAVFVFMMRPVAYIAVLNTVDRERMPFDRHGFGLIGDVALLALMAVPLTWVIAKLVWRRSPCRPLLAPAATPARTALSFAMAFGIALPPPAQWDALGFLNLSENWPIVLANLGWLFIVLVLRTMATAPPLALPEKQP